MFDNLLGDFKGRQEALQKNLENIIIRDDVEDGAIVMEVTATGQVQSIKLDPSKLDMNDPEQLEDLLLVLTNRLLHKAAQKQQEASNSMMKEMMPPGMGDIAKMFGQ